jgi:hypothetical protein
MRITKRAFEVRHTDPDDKPEYEVAVLTGYGSLLYEKTGHTYKARTKTWRTLTGAIRVAEGIELRPERAGRGRSLPDPADLAVVVVDNDAGPAILVVKAAEGSGLQPVDAFQRDHWKFTQVDGVWDIR